MTLALALLLDFLERHPLWSTVWILLGVIALSEMQPLTLVRVHWRSRRSAPACAPAQSKTSHPGG